MEKNKKDCIYKEVIKEYYDFERVIVNFELLKFFDLEIFDIVFVEVKSVKKNCFIYFLGFVCVNVWKFES